MAECTTTTIGIRRGCAEKDNGADIVYYGTQRRGASNAKVKRELDFQPRSLEWLARIAVA